jgi:hypothetical protein
MKPNVCYNLVKIHHFYEIILLKTIVNGSRVDNGISAQALIEPYMKFSLHIAHIIKLP